MTISLYGGNFQKNSLKPKISGSNLCLEPKVQVSTIIIGTPIHSLPIQFGQFGPNLAQFVQLTHFVTSVGSSNLTYALTVVINFRNIL